MGMPFGNVPIPSGENFYKSGSVDMIALKVVSTGSSSTTTNNGTPAPAPAPAPAPGVDHDSSASGEIGADMLLSSLFIPESDDDDKLSWHIGELRKASTAHVHLIYASNAIFQYELMESLLKDAYIAVYGALPLPLQPTSQATR
jgi:hypothetical protein